MRYCLILVTLVAGNLFAEGEKSESVSVPGKSDTATVSKKVADKSGPGFAVHIGGGGLYGGAGGASVEYQFVLRPSLRLTPFVSIGEVMGTDYKATGLGYCSGANIEFGKMKRFFAAATFGTLYIDVGEDSLGNDVKNTTIGPSLMAGYKWITHFGLLLQVSGGMGYNITGTECVDKENTTLAPTFNLGIGYKF